MPDARICRDALVRETRELTETDISGVLVDLGAANVRSVTSVTSVAPGVIGAAVGVGRPGHQWCVVGW